MDKLEQDSITEASKVPLSTLEHVPISAPHIERMTQVLVEHGATLAETKHCPNFGQPYNEYTVTFPPETTRSFGLAMMRSRYFVVLFPDGFQLGGGEMWPLERRDDDIAITVLHLPIDQDKRTPSNRLSGVLFDLSRYEQETR